MAFKHKDLLSLRDVEREEIEMILSTAASMRQLLDSPTKKTAHLQGKSIVTLFYENSTRTRMSFELASKYMSAAAANISASASSVQKGETLLDTGRTLDRMGTDVIIIRHPMSGAPHLLAQHVNAAVINAGDGINEHPTQALLDMFTIKRHKGRLDGLKVAIVGDVLHSRVARSKMDMNVRMPDSLPVGLPSTLLQRRPDVRQAEQNLKAAMAAAGMAYADRFPRLTISLTGGLENDAVKGLINSPFSYAVGNLTAPLFAFGSKRAKYRAALAAYDQARLAYEQKVLEVFREVNDAVTAYRNMRRTAELKFNLKEAARQYVVLAKLQYINGVIRYIDVLDAQRKFFDAQVEESKAVRNEHLALVGLYKALGGGWQPSDVEKKG